MEPCRGNAGKRSRPPIGQDQAIIIYKINVRVPVKLLGVGAFSIFLVVPI
ncbi:MAG: hypothetical protein NTZ74_14525 [Chloroflexi bacterium]|nr:hypothetical protein [Chloroflexota bacterium]